MEAEENRNRPVVISRREGGKGGLQGKIALYRIRKEHGGSDSHHLLMKKKGGGQPKGLRGDLPAEQLRPNKDDVFTFRGNNPHGEEM